MYDSEKILKYYKLKNLDRFATCERVREESVSEHSYFVALFAELICNELEVCDTIRLKCLRSALIHDLPEMELSDIPHPVKQSSKELQDVLDKMEEKFFNDNFKNSSDYIKYIHEYNHLTSPESYILLLSDVLSVIQYCLSEINLGNKNMVEVLELTIERAKRANELIERTFGKRIKQFGDF